jgi:hypothetical protein
MKRLALVPFLVVGLAGCGSVASPDYEGEPLAEFHGYVAWQRPDPMPTVDLMFFWPDASHVQTIDGVTSTNLSTAVRMPLDAAAPAHFDFKVFTPPPDSVYYAPQTEFWGARISDAIAALVTRGATPTTLGDPSVVAKLENYVIGYADRDADKTLSSLDGGQTATIHIRKGYNLSRQDMMWCADGYDQACIDREVAGGWSQDVAQSHCLINPQERTTPVEVPLDTELAFTVTDPNAPFQPPHYTIPCPSR